MLSKAPSEVICQWEEERPWRMAMAGGSELAATRSAGEKPRRAAARAESWARAMAERRAPGGGVEPKRR